MTRSHGNVLLFALLPIVAVIVGGIIAAFKAPGPRLSSYFQHFAAGVVFAAAAGEVLPEITHERRPIPAIIGFAIGVALLLGIRAFTERFEQLGSENDNAWLGLVMIVGIDILIDGFLVGVGFAAGAEQGVLLTIALTLEILFLGLATSASLTQAGTGRGATISVTIGLAVLLAIGLGIGVTLLRGLSGALLEATLAFGAAALLYLVTEELLVEAHEVPETPLTTATFFFGFLVLFIIEMVATAPTTAG